MGDIRRLVIHGQITKLDSRDTHEHDPRAFEEENGSTVKTETENVKGIGKETG